MDSSRRNFLVAGIGLPAIASASRSASPEPQAPAKRASDIKFEYRTLGKTGLKVTSVAFGCMITSDGSVVERGADMGITYFDTAHSYQQGNNERMVGAALKGKRNSITLSSKTHGATKQDALNDLDASLKSLQTDHLDIWYLHAKSKPEEVTDDLIDAQQTAKKAGKIRFAGVSTHAGQPVLVPWLAKNPNVDVILSAYNFTLEPAVTTVLEQAAAAGKGVAVIKVMAGGFRSIKPGDPAYAKLKQDGGLLAALKWAMRNPKVVHAAVPSITDNDQLEENLTAMQKPLRPGGRETAGRAPGAHPAALLPHLRPVRWRLPPGPAGGRHVAHPDLRRWLRTVRLGPRAFPGAGPRAHQREVRRLPGMHGPVPAWSQSSGAPDEGAGTIRLLILAWGVAAPYSVAQAGGGSTSYRIWRTLTCPGFVCLTKSRISANCGR